MGHRPDGWYCRYGPSVNTRRLVVEEGGFLYDSDSYADELPWWVTVDGRGHLVVPYSLTHNDGKYAGAVGTSDDWFAFVRDGFDMLYAEGADAPKMMSVWPIKALWTLLIVSLTLLPARLAARPKGAAELAPRLGAREDARTEGARDAALEGGREEARTEGAREAALEAGREEARAEEGTFATELATERALDAAREGARLASSWIGSGMMLPMVSAAASAACSTDSMALSTVPWTASLMVSAAATTADDAADAALVVVGVLDRPRDGDLPIPKTEPMVLRRPEPPLLAEASAYSATVSLDETGGP